MKSENFVLDIISEFNEIPGFAEWWFDLTSEKRMEFIRELTKKANNFGLTFELS